MSNWQNIRAYAAAVQRQVVNSNVKEKEKEVRGPLAMN